MKTYKGPGMLMGALLGALISAPLMAIFYLGDRFAGLPFIPFDFFDWFQRSLPGPIVTFGIDTMVDLIRVLNIGRLDETAKLAEQSIALGLFLFVGLLAGALFFAILARLNTQRSNSILGVFFGLVLAGPMLLISNQVNVTASADPILGAVWVVMLLVGYGVVLHSLYMSLTSFASASAADADGSRREFLVRVGGATATLTVIGAGLGTLLNTGGEGTPTSTSGTPVAQGGELTDGLGNPLPNAGDPVEPAPGTRLEYTPVEDHYRIDIATRPPELDATDWRLVVDGLVENPVEWSLDELRALPAMSAFITMSCISNRVGGSLISTTKWTGFPMSELLDRVQPSPEARALRITSADGFDEYVPIDLAREDDRIMFAYDFDDAPLPVRNGFPLRIHIPNRFGMKQPKWIERIEFVDELGDGYWVRRGWSYNAYVRATSVIDTVATDAVYERDGQMFVPIGGMAWAGDRGIEAVEVRVDDGEWQEAELRSPISERTWWLWRFDWPFQEGSFRFEVRMREGDGTPQIEQVAGVRPDGATGFHSINQSVRAPEPESAG